MSFDIETDSIGFHSTTNIKFNPKHTSFMSCKERIKSYKEWPEQIREKKIKANRSQ